MGRPRKAKQPQEVPHAHVEDEHEGRQPLILPASDSAMDLDLDMAFFDMNDINFLDLLGPDYSSSTLDQSMTEPPKQLLPDAHPRSVWGIMSAEHLGQDINFDHQPEPHYLSEEVSLEQAAQIMTVDIPQTPSLPALSPQESSSASDHASPSSAPQPTICVCLSSLYLALDSLQRLPTSVSSAMHVARTASKTAHATITCPTCSTPDLDPTSPSFHPPVQSLQNMMMLGALLPSLSNAYKTILHLVDEEAAAAALAGRKITFTLATYGGLWGPLAASDHLCGATEGMEGKVMEPSMWRLTVRALLRIDVYGLSGCTPGWDGLGPAEDPVSQHGLKDIIRLMEERSVARHEQIDRLVEAGLLQVDGRCGGEYVPLGDGTGEKPTCFRIIDIAKRSMQSLVIA